MQTALSSRRLYLLLRMDLRNNRRTLALFSATLAGILLLLSLANRGPFAESDVYRDAFGVTLFVWGIGYATGRAFRNLHDPNRKEAYLLLPASALEKALAGLLWVAAGQVLHLLALFTVLSLAIELSVLAWTGYRHPFFDPTEADVWRTVVAFVVVQSPYVLGAVWFRRLPFLKTTLILVVALLALVLAPVALLHVSFDGFGWHHWELVDAVEMLILDHGTALQVLLFAALALVPPALWTIAWMRLQEAQADDGV